MKVQCIHMASIKEMQLEIFTLHILKFLYNGMCVGAAWPLHWHTLSQCVGSVARLGGAAARWHTGTLLPHLPGHKLPGASCN